MQTSENQMKIRKLQLHNINFPKYTHQAPIQIKVTNP